MKKSLKLSIIIQTISYIIIVLLYLRMSSANLAIQNTADPSLSFVKNVNAVVYYISPDSELYKINIDGTGNEKVLSSRINYTSRLSFMKSDNKNYLDLYDAKDPKKPILIASKVQEITNKSRFMTINEKISSWRTADMRDLKEKDRINIRYGMSDIIISDELTGKKRKYSIVTPFAIWIPKNLSLVPNNFAIFELFDTDNDPRFNQIVVWDYNNKKIGLLARGRSPVVVYN